MTKQTCLNCRYFGGYKGDTFYCSRRNTLYYGIEPCGDWKPAEEATT